VLTKRAAAKAIERFNKQKVSQTAFRLEDFLFDKQLAFVKDPYPFKLALCSRRSGKTVACAADLIFTAVNNPGSVCVYITLNRAQAKKIIWPEIKKINRTYNLKGQENISELSITFPNHSMIYLSGAKDMNEIEKFRGLAIKLCYIDEAQSFRSHIQELINDVLSPALMDHAGTLCLTGTPGPVPTGFFYDCTKDESNWSKHKWTFWDNPFITITSKSTHQEMLERELTIRGVPATNPSIQREWFGRWVLDADSLILHYEKEKNDYSNLPVIAPDKFNYIMGIDLGFIDADAIAVVAWSEKERTTYLVEEIVISKQGITEIAEQIKQLDEKYHVSKMVIDEGGLGKKIAEEIRRRHHLPLIQAEKTRKMENYAFLNDALRTGAFKAKANSIFAHDSYLVEIDREKSKPDKIVISNRFHSDIIDAVLYAFKESPAFTYQKPIEPPKYGTAAWAKAEQERMLEEELEKMQNQRDKRDEYGY